MEKHACNVYMFRLSFYFCIPLLVVGYYSRLEFFFLKKSELISGFCCTFFLLLFSPPLSLFILDMRSRSGETEEGGGGRRKKREREKKSFGGCKILRGPFQKGKKKERFFFFPELKRDSPKKKKFSFSLFLLFRPRKWKLTTS